MRPFSAGIIAALLAGSPAHSAPDPAPEVVTGRLTVIQLDDFAGRRSELLYSLEDESSGRRYRLQFDGHPRAALRSGRILTVRGVVRGNSLVVDPGYAFASDTGSTGTSSGATSGAYLDATVVSGDQRTLVMLGNFNDSVLQCSAQYVRDLMFSDPYNRSIDDYYRATSDGKVSLSGEVAGPYTLDVSAPQSCDIELWADAMDAAARGRGIDVSAYPRRMYVLPKYPVCPAGAGSVGDSPSRAWVFACSLTDVYAHEFGHNLGMGHAATPNGTYGDTSDIMGLSGVGLREVNAPHAEQMGWKVPAMTRTVTASGTYDVAPLPFDETQAVASQILKIAKADTGEHYYLSYRTRVGFDTNLYSDYYDKVSVHLRAPDAAKTVFLTALADGQSFTDSVNGVSITMVGHTSDYATVTVSLAGGTSCVRAAPVVKLSPADQSVAAGQAVKYSVSVGNADSGACGSSSFSLAAKALPAGWTGQLSPTSLSISAGGSATATFTVTSSASASPGAYSVGVQASNPAVATHAGSASAVLNVTSSCVRRSPTLTLGPATQGGTAGTSLGYEGSLRNNDDPTCSARSLSLSQTLPAGWSGSISPGSVSLAAGQSTALNVQAASSASAPAGTYSVTVSVHDSASGTVLAGATVSYAVLATADVTPPSAPTGLSVSVDAKRKRATLSWSASSDNVGVVAYRIWRDGVVVGESSGTWYMDGALSAGATYSYYVTAMDASGNHSSGSNVATATVVRSPGGGRK